MMASFDESGVPFGWEQAELTRSEAVIAMRARQKQLRQRLLSDAENAAARDEYTKLLGALDGAVRAGLTQMVSRACWVCLGNEGELEHGCACTGDKWSAHVECLAVGLLPALQIIRATWAIEWYS